MSGPGPVGPARPATPAPLTAEQAKLRKLSHQLEGVFLGQLFQAMRATVPSDESPDAAGREIFTAMLDDTFASRAAERMRGGLGDALYRQLSRRLAAGGGADPAAGG